jgi:hypothetical protein
LIIEILSIINHQSAIVNLDILQPNELIKTLAQTWLCTASVKKLQFGNITEAVVCSREVAPGRA